MEQVQKAELWVYWQETQEGSSIDVIPLQFNPTEISLEKGAQIAEIGIPGLDSPLLQFVRGQNERMTLELFFDTTEDGMGVQATSVTTETDRIYSLMKIQPDGHAPPICEFVWNDNFPGSHLLENLGSQRREAFKCIVENVRQRFTLFSPEGIPLRATLTVTFREYKTLEDQINEENPSSPTRTHYHVTRRDERLSAIAARYYRRPGEWRQIAEANNIEDPRRMAPGVFLAIPPME